MGKHDISWNNRSLMEVGKGFQSLIYNIIQVQFKVAECISSHYYAFHAHSFEMLMPQYSSLAGEKPA